MEIDSTTPDMMVRKQEVGRSVGSQLELPFRATAAVGKHVGSYPHVSIRPLDFWPVDKEWSMFAPLYESCRLLFGNEERSEVYPFVLTVKPAAKSSRALKSAYSTVEAFCAAVAAMKSFGVHIDRNDWDEIRVYVWPFGSTEELAKDHLRKAWKHVERVLAR